MCTARRPARSVKRIRPSLSLKRLSAPLLFHPSRLRNIKSTGVGWIDRATTGRASCARLALFTPRAIAPPAPVQPGHLSKSAALALATTSCAVRGKPALDP
eukprot:4887975-Pleurochrysis_carterae.AAC.4